MMADPNGVSTREQRLQDVLAGYYEAAEDGGQPDRQELFDRHPDLAADLIEFFAIQDELHRRAEPFRGLEPSLATMPMPMAHETREPSPVGEDRFLGDYELLGEIARGGM